MQTCIQATGSIQAAHVRSSHPRAGSLKQRGGLDEKLAALMRAAQKGDRAAYASLLQELVGLLQRLMRRRFGFLQATDRDDLMQDILLSVHAARATYDPSRPFMPWLMGIAHNRMVDRVRRRVKMSRNEVLVDEFEESISNRTFEPANPEYRDSEALHQAVSGLPASQRTAIELVKLRELSLREAANLTGRSMGALKVAVHRAMKSLRGSLGAASSQPLWKASGQTDSLLCEASAYRKPRLVDPERVGGMAQRHRAQ